MLPLRLCYLQSRVSKGSVGRRDGKGKKKSRGLVDLEAPQVANVEGLSVKRVFCNKQEAKKRLYEKNKESEWIDDEMLVDG